MFRSFKTLHVALVASIFLSLSWPAQALDKISIGHFGAPSFGAFLPPVIKANKLDEKHGLLLEFSSLTPDAYTTAFNSGQIEVGASAASLAIGLADTRGIDVTNLFNVFDFWCAVVTSRPEIKTLKDLEGAEIAAARGTASYVMFEWFAKQQGIDVKKFSVVNTATPGLLGYAMADRAAAVQLWEPAYSMLMARKPNTRSVDLKLQETWNSFAGSKRIPYQGVAASRKWVEANPKLVTELYQTYKDAGDWIVAHPADAAALILPAGTPEERSAIAQLIAAPERLGLDVAWANDMRPEINSIYKLGRETGLLTQDPSSKSIYTPASN